MHAGRADAGPALKEEGRGMSSGASETSKIPLSVARFKNGEMRRKIDALSRGLCRFQKSRISYDSTLTS